MFSSQRVQTVKQTIEEEVMAQGKKSKEKKAKSIRKMSGTFLKPGLLKLKSNNRRSFCFITENTSHLQTEQLVFFFACKDL